MNASFGYWCWSSSEYSSNNSWNINNNGNVNNNNKNNDNNNIRVRSFAEFVIRGINPIKIRGGFAPPHFYCRCPFMENKGWIPLEDVFEAYYECRRNKRNTANALKYEIDYEANLVRLWKDINLERYEIGRSICFLVTRPKLREVFAADFRDRIVHHIIMKRLEPLFERVFINGTYSCRKGKGTLYGIRDLDCQIREKTEDYSLRCFVGKFDMKGFFMTIHKRTLLDMLVDFVERMYCGEDKGKLLYLIRKVVMNRPQDNCDRRSPIQMWNDLPSNKSLFTCGDEYGLPIGNLTSQCFANFYLDGFDKHVLSKFGYYGRYVDDFFVLADSSKEISGFIPQMASYLKDNLHVTLHQDKVYIQDTRNGVSFIGGVVRNHRMYVSNRTVSNVHKAMNRMNRQITSENAEKFMQTMNSYFGFMKHYRSYRIKKRILKKIDTKWWKFIIYNKKRGIISIRKQ